MKPGFGVRHPAVPPLLASVTPASSADVTWPNGDRIRVSAYLGSAEIPDELIQGVRCLVRVGDQLVICQNAHGVRHPWPGGRREQDESLHDTAIREVHEETGWRLEPNTLEQLGWLHSENLTPVRVDHPFPNPDSFQLVFVATAVERDGVGDWTDTEGYELSSELVPLSEVAAVITEPACETFVAALMA